MVLKRDLGIKMKLKTLLKDFASIEVKGSRDVEISGLCINSQLVAPGDLFIALQGDKFDGSEFILDAIAGGACAILTDMFNPFLKKNVTQVIVPKTRDILGALAAKFYGAPSLNLFLVGITGTNGKTTSSYLLRHLFEQEGFSTGLIGTISYIIGSYEYQAPRTTPDVVTIHKLLRDMVNQSCQAAVMEVSSHGLVQKRVSGVHFDVGLFTNTSAEHLDYHKDIHAYRQAKELLFLPKESSENAEVAPLKWAIINADEAWVPGVDKATKVISYGFSKKADMQAEIISQNPENTKFEVSFQNKKYLVEWPFIGAFNVSNALGSLAAAYTKGIPLSKACKHLKSVPQIPGRLEKVANDQGLHVFVDYAHTDDALEKVLTSLQAVKERKVITLFGCGGERDKEKRPRMAAVAEKLSDQVVITSDNPRMEDPSKILDEIETGFKKKNHKRVLDRSEAIYYALSQASEGDIVLIAGKGHEKYQVQGHQTHPFDDLAIAKDVLDGIAL